MYEIIAQATLIMETFDLPSWLGDAGWWQVILAVVAILIGFVFFALQRQNRSLSYNVVASTALLSVDSKIKGRVQILLDGQSVDDVHYVLVRIINTGSVSIIPDDFITPISIESGNDSQILSAEIVETDPPELEVPYAFDTSKITISKLLLNKEDYFDIKILTNKKPDSISVLGRIVGIKQITHYLDVRLVHSMFDYVFDKRMRRNLAICVAPIGLLVLALAIFSGNYAIALNVFVSFFLAFLVAISFPMLIALPIAFWITRRFRLKRQKLARQKASRQTRKL